MARKPAVIAINSLVVRGSVGGRASVFVLERLGFPVWSLPTLILPWHLGHGRASRLSASPEDFAGLIADLCRSPKLAEVGAVLSGYLAGAGQAEAVAELVASVKRANPSALYLCDPIIGDSGGLFQPESVAAAIRDRLIPLADIATPNRHELDWLTGTAASSNQALVAAARRLGPAEVVVTSAFAPDGSIAALVAAGEEAVVASHRRLADVPHGTGDLFAALYLAHRLDGRDAARSLAVATSATLRLIEMAVATGADEMPLAAGQSAFAEPPAGIILASLDET